VFLDLRGFTGFAETPEPKEVMGVLRQHHEAMGQLVLPLRGLTQPVPTSSVVGLKPPS
jgi:class 3 adenylate cyclase